jgi:hypothetical protein
LKQPIESAPVKRAVEHIEQHSARIVDQQMAKAHDTADRVEAGWRLTAPHRAWGSVRNIRGA